MFGENESESPRTPSPWISRSTSPRVPVTRAPVVVVVETLVVGRATATTMIAPEVDDTGAYEYKYKLARPESAHRLERLRTQCKWRLVQGGGACVYELGVLDHGELVGLDDREMRESLDTLATMLAGLGGGTVSVSRVLRLIHPTDNDDDDDGDGDGRAQSPFVPVVVVDPVDPDTDLGGTCDLSTVPIDIAAAAAADDAKGPTPFPLDRTPAELAELKRSKRDARRRCLVHRCEPPDAARSKPKPADADGHRCDGRRYPHQHSHSHSHAADLNPNPVPVTPKPPKPPRRRKVVAREERDEQRRLKRERQREADGLGAPEGGGGGGGRPRLRLQPGEVRWVVEALVEKRSSTTTMTTKTAATNVDSGKDTARRGPDEGFSDGRSTTEDEDDDNDDDDDDDDDDEGSSGSRDRKDGHATVEEEEGWNFLTFDLKELSTSAKVAAAAAAAAPNTTAL
ncbi:hypothetical protein JCM11491_004968 [Sporobolomyces phaffii]